MSNERRLILVTGAPRTATTPVGNTLTEGAGAVSLYEPLGPTGLRAVSNWYPMAGEGLDLTGAQLARLLDDLRHSRSGGLKSQVRIGNSWNIKIALFGSRTLHSFRIARLQPWKKTVIWKDPHAIMLANDVVEAGVSCVVTLRTPHAHAASYKRLGWTSQAREIYPRWSLRFGPCAICEAAFSEIENPVVSGALIWRMSYLSLIRTGALDRVHLVTSEALAADEEGTYRRLFEVLGLKGADTLHATLAKRQKDAKAVPDSKTTHDWNRSVAAVNSYWKDLLSPEEIRKVDDLTADVFETVSSRPSLGYKSAALSQVS